MEPGDSSSGSGAPKSRGYKIHWHIVLTHFPIGAFTGAFLFMGLHLLTKNSCDVPAAYVSLIAGAAVLIPTTATGWFTWKHQYEGLKSTLFLIKIWTSAVMLALSIALVAYQTLYPFTLLDVTHRLAHSIYFIGVLLLMIGGVIEGVWGARLHHR